MDGIETHAIELVKASVGAKLDPFPVLKELLHRHIISAEQYHTFLHDAVCGDGDFEMWCRLLEHLQKHCSFLTLINILMTTGQIGLAQILLDLIKRGNDTLEITRVNKIQTDNRKSIRLFFKNLKSHVHDARFGNPREALRMLANRYQDKLRSEMNVSRKQYLADKLVAILGVEIDAHAITFNDNLSQHELFDELKSMVHDSSNTMMTDLSYYGRLANANAIGGRFSEGKDMLIKAQCSASNFTACLEVANMYSIQVYFLLWEFEATHSQKLKQSLLEMATKGIASLQEEDDEIRILWTRMFLLRMIFCLLGIGNRANVLQGYSPSQEDIMQALNLLENLRWASIWDGIETRREMFYWVAMSRVNDLKGNGSEAISNILTALQLARSGKFKEVTFIGKYSKELETVASNALKQDWHWHQENTSETHPYTSNFLSCGLSRSLGSVSNYYRNPGFFESHTWRFGLSGNVNRQTFEEGGLHSYQSRNCPDDLDHLESYTWRMDLSGNEHNFEEGTFPLQQISGDDQLSDLWDSFLFETAGGNNGSDFGNRECHITNRNAKPHHDVYLDSGTSSTEVISPYDSASGSTTFACSYLHHKEVEGGVQTGVYLYHLASRRYNDADDRSQQELMATNVREANFCDEHCLWRSFDLIDDPYSSLDSLHLFGPGIHKPEDELNSIVLFEDRSEPEGDSFI